MSDTYLAQAPSPSPPWAILGTANGSTVIGPPGSPVPGADPWGAAGFTTGPSGNAPPTSTDTADPWSSAAFSATPPKTPTRQVGTGEAAVTGATNAASFGLAPAIAGLTQAGMAGKTPAEQEAIQPTGIAEESPGLESVGEGLARLYSNHPDPEAQAAYQRGRQSALQNEQLSQEQHPGAYLAGQFVGSLLTPSFGIAAPGTIGTRIAAGAIGGAVGGAAYGGGSAVSRGESAPQVAQSAAEGGLVGGPTGAILNGVLGRLGTAPAVTPGRKAAQTAADLGAPLPRGVASDSPVVQNTTAKLQSMPLTGDKISQKLRATQEAAGQAIGDTANTMGATDRAAADAMVRPGLQSVIDTNKQAIDQAYGGVRGAIDQNARFTMPRTDATLNAIMKERQAAGHSNPAQGLEQFRTVAGSATFNGAHRARVDAREAGNALVPHPGYNAADYNRLTRAMTADLREMVRAAAAQKGNNPAKALAAFDAAEKQFGALAEQNDILNRLINSKREGAIATLMNAANAKSGDLKLLAQLRQKMPQAEFEQIGGTLLNELGHRAASGDFSLAQFVSNWNKLSDGAKRVLFSPQHLQNINDIVGMGEHIKGALANANTSHTSDMMILWDVLRAAGEGTVAVGAGLVSPTAGVGLAASFALPHALTLWLASPAKAASMAAWNRSYRALVLERTPARISAFKIATRNMANTLGLDPMRALTAADSLIRGRAQPSEQPSNKPKQ